MTEKEKSYVSCMIAKNIKNSQKFKDYSKFFNASLIQLKISIPKEKKIIQEKNTKLKEIFKTIGKTYKKSKKMPRFVVKESQTELSRSMNIKIAFEEIYDIAISKKYINNPDLKYELNFTEELFFYFLEIPKFYKMLTLIFEVYDEETKKTLFIYLIKYSLRISYTKELKNFVDASYMNFSNLSIEEFEELSFFNNFFFNISNLIIGTGILLKDNFYGCVFYNYLCNENLELVFSLDGDFAAWRFLSVLLKLVNDNEKANIVGLLREKVLECINTKDVENLKGLELFLDAIGLEKDDITEM
ncbi:hypothetical protein GVAV_000287 [Gurleya vavrai]